MPYETLSERQQQASPDPPVPQQDTEEVEVARAIQIQRQQELFSVQLMEAVSPAGVACLPVVILASNDRAAFEAIRTVSCTFFRAHFLVHTFSCTLFSAHFLVHTF